MPHFVYDNKKVFFDVRGQGAPLLLLHGNSVSSAVFASHIRFYSRCFKVVTLDYPGHGKSERLDRFPDDFWWYNAGAAIALCEHLGVSHVNVMGTSGGAIVALNMALEAPHLVARVVADSFSGEELTREDVLRIADDRERGKRRVSTRLFWRAMHGPDWRVIVDEDTSMLRRFTDAERRSFHGDLSKITCPVLLTGSLQDELIANIEARLKSVAGRIERSEVFFFARGRHPALVSRRRDFRRLAIAFFNRYGDA